MPDLPTGLDAEYADSPLRPSVKRHQQHHDVVHAVVNRVPDDGSLVATEASVSTTYARQDGVVGKGAEVIHADDYASLTAALAAASAGSTVIITGAITTTGVTVPDDVTVQAQGRATVTLLTGGAGAAFTLGNRSVVNGARIDLALTGKSGVLVPTGKADATATNIRVTNAATGTGFSAAAAVRPTFAYCSTDGAKYGVLLNTGTTDALVLGGSHVNGTATTSYEASLYVPNAIRARIIGVTVSGAAGHGAWIGGATTADITLIGCTFRACGTVNDHRGVTVDSSCNRILFEGCTSEANYEAGFYVSGPPRHVRFVGCTARGNNVGLRPGGHGFEHLGALGHIEACTSIGQLGDAANEGCGIYVGTNGTPVANCTVEGNYSAGIRAVNSNNAIISGNRVRNNSQRGAGLHDGIEVTGLSAGASLDVQVIGNRCYDDQATKTQRYGINVVNANVDWYMLTANSTRGNATGGISDAGGVNKVAANNLGA